MWCIQLSFIILLSLFIHAAADDKRLRVSVRKDALQGGSSCIHAVSQVELLNLDPTESIVIHSIKNSAEETVFNVPWKESYDGNEGIPSQFQVLKLQEGGLTLQPSQVALVPLTFLPRYPRILTEAEAEQKRDRKKRKGRGEYNNGQIASGRGNFAVNEQVLTDVGVSDLEYVDENELAYQDSTSAKRSNLGMAVDKHMDVEYNVRTTLIIDTSRGVVEHKISASSVRRNIYNVPDTIRFYNTSPKDCFHLHMSNPHKDKPLEVYEMTVSRSDIVMVEHESLYSREPSSNLNGVAQGWSNGGPFILKPGAREVYVASVCAFPRGSESHAGGSAQVFESNSYPGIDPGNPKTTLGFLQIRSAESLFVILERGTPTKDDFLSDVNKMIAEFGSATAQDETYSESQSVKISESPEVAEKTPSLRDDVSAAEAADLYEHVELPQGVKEQTLLHAIPSTVNVLIITSAKASAAMRISLHNAFHSPVKIMLARSTIKLSSGDLNINVDFGEELIKCPDGPLNCTYLGTDGRFPETKPIPPATTVDNVITVSCSVGPDSSSWGFSPTKRAVRINGTVMVRGTSNTSMVFEDWNEKLKSNPYLESHLRLEIPYTVILTDGKVDFAMEDVASYSDSVLFAEKPFSENLSAASAMLFPLDRDEFRESIQDKESIKTTGGIERHARVFSPMLLTLNPVVEILVGNIDAQNSTAVGNNFGSLCSRFKVTSIAKAAVQDGQPLLETQLFDLGTISLKYVPESFGEQYDRFVSQTCFLRISTKPVDTGRNGIPLVIFSGKLEVATSEMGVPSEENAKEVEGYTNETVTPHRDFSTGAIAGFDNLVSWFQSSTMGSVLSSVLQNVYRGERQSTSRKCSSMGSKGSHESKLLCKYLLEISNSSVFSESTSMNPILLEHGAIGHGEIQTTSLYLTNRNPVAVEIFIDVGEVQGISISLGRDAAQEKGDGNSVLDYIPKEGEGVDDEASATKWGGHSLNGLRQFLASSDTAQSLFAGFPHRDAVSLSQFAVKKEPLLRELYRSSATADFHMYKALDCHPPVYTQSDSTEPMFRNVTDLVDDMPGPLLLSVDQGLLHPLRITSEKQRLSGCPPLSSESSDNGLDARRQISVPPGGVARFEVQVRGPPKETLSKDVTPLIASGLVLSTNFGEVMPIISTYEALVGQLRVSHFPVPSSTQSCAADKKSAKREADVEVIDVPPGLFQSESDLSPSVKVPDRRGSGFLIIPPDITSNSSYSKNVHGNLESDGQSNNVSLFLTSTFSREVRLKGVESCNPWFEVVLKEAENATKGSGRSVGVEIGTLHSVISCLPPRSPVVGKLQSAQKVSLTLPEFPSFYQCALNWLESRSTLQPRGCGQETPSRNRRVFDDDTYEAEDGDVVRVKLALKKAVSHLDMFYSGWKKPGVHTHQQSHHPVVSSALDTGALDTVESGTGVVSSSIKSGVGRSFGTVASGKVDLFAEVTDSWKAISEVGLHKVTSSLRATIDYSYPGNNTVNASTCHVDGESIAPEAGTRSLTVSMGGLALQTALTTPRLFDCTRSKQRTRRPKSSGDEALSVFDFPPTLVANVVALTVPLKNPTSVPVRVRLSSVSPETMDRDGDVNDFSFSTNDDVRDRYLQHHSGLHIQNSVSTKAGSGGNAQKWWEDGGAFYLHDENGDMIQSHHNITIRAGAGAHVSLVNPSLHATSAFLVGCGRRCGDHEDASSITANGLNVDRTFIGMPRELSPIGASSGGKATLMGRPSLTTQVNGVDILEPVFSAGGAPPTSVGPAAFAVPYSSLDEIVLPPYGEAELGPIFFRPPGRRRILGCDFPVDKSSRPGEGTPDACLEKYFESMVFLENSLTGLERVVLRGKALWERVVFLDPVVDDGGETMYGDIENRHGRSTLVFPGSGRRDTEYHPGGRPIVKSVVVHNAGDVQIQFDGVYFSDASFGEPAYRREEQMKMNEYRPRMLLGVDDPSGGCESRNFRLLGCWDGDRPVERKGKKEKRNIRHGFRLLPGHNRTLHIEHRPDCTFRQDYVTLNLEYRRTSSFYDDDSVGNITVSRSGAVRNARANHWGKSFRKRNVELFVGFDMGNSDVADCIPVYPRKKVIPKPWFMNIFLVGWFQSKQPQHGVDGNTTVDVSSSSIPTDYIMDIDEYKMPAGTWFLRFASVLLSLVLIALIVAYGIASRHRSCLSFNSSLRGKSYEMDPLTQSSNLEASGTSSLWSAAFRCLARADPTLSELQTLGREQVRQVVLNRYKSLGIFAPQCITSLGGFQRERPGSGGGAVVKNNGKDGNIGGGEKIRTLSDALFQGFVSNPVKPESALLPCGLDWRTAVARGIVDGSSVATLEHPRFPLKVRELLVTRSMLVQRDSQSPGEQVLQEQDTGEKANHEHTEAEFAKHVDEGERMSASDAEGNRSNHSKTEHVSVANIPKTSEDVSKNKVPPGEAEVVNGSFDGTHQIKREEPKRGVQQIRDSGSRDQKVAVGVNQGPGDEALPQRTSQAQSKKENANVDVDSPATSSSKKSKKKNNVASTNIAKKASQKPKSQRELHRRAESNDTRSSDGSESISSKGNRKVSSASSRKADNAVKNSRDVSNLGSKGSRQRVGGRAPEKRDAAPTVSRKGKPSSLAPVVQEAQTVAKKKKRPSPPPSVPFSPGSLKTASPQSWSPSVVKPSPVLRPPPGLAPPPGFDSPGRSNVTSKIGEQELGLPAVPSIEKVSVAGSTEGFDSLLPRSQEPPASNAKSGVALSSSSSAHGNEDRVFSNTISPPVAGSALVQPVGGKALSNTDLNLPSLSPSSAFSTESPVVKKDTVSAAVAAAAPIGKPAETGGKPLLGLGGGFNVVDFLDSILDETKNTSEESDVDDASEEISEGSLPSTLPPGFPAYPAERKSRAAAYGIAVEETVEDAGVETDGTSIVRAMLSLSPERQTIRSDDVDSMVNSIPLLTPAVILGESTSSIQNVEEIFDKEKKPEHVFNYNTFHTRLLDE